MASCRTPGVLFPFRQIASGRWGYPGLPNPNAVMRVFQAPTPTVSKPVPKCPKCGAEILLGHQLANADHYYPIAVIKLQGADPDSGVRWVWNEGVCVNMKPSWLYWLFGFQWLPCPHCGAKVSRLGRKKDLSVYPVVELPPVPATTLEDKDEFKRDSSVDQPIGLPNRGRETMTKNRASAYALYGVIVSSMAVVIASALASYHETGAITLSGMIEAQKTNPVLWVVDSMLFFALWGKYVSSVMGYEASAMVIDQTSELRAHTTMLEDPDEVKRDSAPASAEETGARGAEEPSEQAARAKITPEEDALDDDSTYDRNYAVYDPKLDQHSPQRLTLVAELRHAIDADQLMLHYQPTVNIKTRQVTAVEALVRWQHPQYDLLSPDDFIPLAERTGLIKPLTLWVLTHALKQHGAWKKEGLDIGVAVNMSAHGLLDLELPDLIGGLLTRHEVSADRLILEITGTNMIVDQQRALQILTRLTDMGVRLCQGDFGTGYSSLSYLSKFPVKEIKIDKSYVFDMIENDQHAMIVRATIDLGHNLGLNVIGEGTTNEEIFAELEKLGCDTVQGAYISQALSAEGFSRWIQDSPWRPKQIS